MNLAGIGYLSYLGFLVFKERFLMDRLEARAQKPTVKKTEDDIINDDLIQDDDDLLKNMDLSDLDNLDLDDFE